MRNGRRPLVGARGIPALALLGLVGSTAQASTPGLLPIVVPDQRSTLTSALTFAPVGHTIVVKDTYDPSKEPGDTVTIDKSITIVPATNATPSLPRLVVDLTTDETVQIGNIDNTGGFRLWCASSQNSNIAVDMTARGAGELILEGVSRSGKFCYGNGIRTSGGVLTLEQVTLGGFGRLLEVDNSQARIKDSHFLPRTARNYLNPTAITFDGQIRLLELRGTTIESGGIRVESAGKIRIFDSVFQDVRGTALHAVDVKETLIRNTAFLDGTNVGDGALYWSGRDGSLFEMENVQVVGNSGDAVGGVQVLRGLNTTTGTTKIHGSWFCGNQGTTSDLVVRSGQSVTVRGNAFANGDGSRSVHLARYQNTNLVNNTYVNHGGGVSLVPNGYLDVRNNAFQDVSDPFPTLTYSTAQGGYNASYDSGSFSAPAGFWMVDDDPLFQAYAPSSGCDALSLHLSTASPLRNAGDPLIQDLDGSRSDIGAFGGPDANLVDGDNDGYFDDLDCDDTDHTVHPGATDTWYDGVDQDCDGANDYDRDGDGYVAVGYEDEAGGTAPNTGDCDETRAAVNPGADEIWYDDRDQDCDGANDYDRDGDGFVHADHAGRAGGTAPKTGDCDDTRLAVNPAAIEIWYDGRDQDCDAANDYDQDGDGFVHVDHAAGAGGTAPKTGDCDDLRAAVNPGAPEIWYDGFDQNCDGANDYDGDGDGYVHSSHATRTGGTAPHSGDCDDVRGDVNPGASDTWYDGLDQDCDGANDFDADGDGYVHADHDARAGGTAPHTGDCEDDRAAVNPGATETWYDGLDQDCDGANDYDADGDGHVGTAYNAKAGGTAPGTDDCDESDAAVNPSADEIWYDGFDQDCDGAHDYDADGDGFVPADYAQHAGGTAPNTDDCDDTRADAHPGAEEVWYDGVDQACDGGNDFDQDGDGYVHADHPDGADDAAPYVGDCVDDPAGQEGIAGNAIHPDAEEVWYDGVDQDCSGGSDYDRDGDGEDCDGSSNPECNGSTGSDCVDDPEGEAGFPGDQIHTGATETWYDGFDQDCDDGDDYDKDRDGHASAAHGGDDCNDDADTIYPGAPEVAGDNVDQDCDGQDATESDLDEDDRQANSGGCSQTGAPASPWWLLAAAALFRRKRR